MAARSLAWVFALCALALHVSRARAQELEPRSYSNAPVGLNFLVAGYAYGQGSVSLDPAVPLADAKLHTHSMLAAYARALDFWGHSAKLDVVGSYTWLAGSARYEGEPVTREVDGFSDPRLRLAVNFFGSPALSLKDFAVYRQDLIVGASIQVVAPIGQYDSTRLVNISSHRWSFKPELGVSKVWGAWTFEAAPSVVFYASNNAFLNGGTITQSPLYALQLHVIHSFAPGIWAALNGTYYGGGRSTINGVERDTRQSNTRLGATVALPVSTRNSVKLFGSIGTTSRIGTNLNVAGLTWQYRFGGGI